MSIRLLAVAIVGVIISCQLPVANTFSFKLSRLLYDDDSNNHGEYQRPVFPRRDLKEEFGEAAYQCLVESALAVEDGVCFNEDVQKLEIENDIDGNQVPTTSPVESDNGSNIHGEAYEYGVDVSFPMHDSFPRQDTLDNRLEFYKNFMQGCRNYYPSNPKACFDSEVDRLDMNLNQPPVMQNYTTLGFQKTRAPDNLMKLLKKFWIDNQERATEEKWYPGDTHTNHWKAKTHMLNVENPHLEGGGMALKNKIWEAAENTLSRWMETDKYPLTPTSLYGIRMYSEGAVLAPHVDRLPLVMSAIINVAQDVEEPWPLELYGHDGKAYNVTMEPGDMLLYESHSVIHGELCCFVLCCVIDYYCYIDVMMD